MIRRVNDIYYVTGEKIISFLPWISDGNTIVNVNNLSNVKFNNNELDYSYSKAVVYEEGNSAFFIGENSIYNIKKWLKSIKWNIAEKVLFLSDKIEIKRKGGNTLWINKDLFNNLCDLKEKPSVLVSYPNIVAFVAKPKTVKLILRAKEIYHGKDIYKDKRNYGHKEDNKTRITTR